jgi:DNA (cytosine-5)-methyltransferase 1
MKVLDLCCGAGGASAGIMQAGCDVTGVDVAPQPHYPYRFIQADALALDLDFIRSFDWLWASPPCQAYVLLQPKRIRGKYPDLMEPMRAMLTAAGRPFVMENVPNAPLRRDLLLCGTMFGLKVIRHRVFEIHGFDVEQPYHPPCRGRIRMRGYSTVAGTGADGLPGTRSLRAWSAAMGIDWMPYDALRESIPPAYSRYIAEYATGARHALPLLAMVEYH